MGDRHFSALEVRSRFSQAKGSALEARAYFLLLAQKKVAKEKGTPGSAPGKPGSLRYSAGRAACQNSPAAQTRQADDPRPTCVAQRLSRGHEKRLGSKNLRKIGLLRSTPRKGQKSNPRNHLSPRRLAPPPDKGEAGRGFRLSGPLGGAEQRRSAGGFRLALSEPKASLASRPALRVAQGTGVAGTDPGSPFLCLLSFGEAKESKPPRKGGNPCQKMPPSKEQQEC